VNPVLLTRDRFRDARLSEALEKRGFSVLQWPAIELRPRILKGGQTSLDEALDWADSLVFPSPGAVACVWRQWPDFSLGLRVRRLAVFAQGPGTKRALMQRGLETISVPQNHNSSGLAQCILENSGAGQRALLMVGNLARQELPELLRLGGLETRSLVVYDNCKPLSLARPQIPLACAVYASPSAARHHFEENPWLQGLACVAYGSTTSKWLENQSIPQRLEVADNPSWRAVLAAIKKLLDLDWKGET
jgi:uroporphyrinogen III methyltransferase/synthase